MLAAEDEDHELCHDFPLIAGEECFTQREGMRHGVRGRIETIDIRACLGKRHSGQFADVVRAVRAGDHTGRDGVARRPVRGVVGRRERRARRRRAPGWECRQ